MLESCGARWKVVCLCIQWMRSRANRSGADVSEARGEVVKQEQEGSGERSVNVTRNMLERMDNVALNVADRPAVRT